MQYGININFFRRGLSLEKAAELISKAGFTQLDYTPPVQAEDWKTQMEEALKIFSDNGLSVHQTHAPFNRYKSYPNHELYQLCLARCAEATAAMGAEFMVAHGDEFDFDSMEFSPERALEYNHNLFAPYVADGSYKVAFETVFEDMKKRRYTSDADELLALIQSYNSPNAVCCWDFGHSHVAFKKEAPSVIRKLGLLIQCTHLHDNAGNDSHQMPLTGDIDWEATTQAFREIGYSGVISIEYAHGRIPEALAESFIKLSYEAACHIFSKGA